MRRHVLNLLTALSLLLCLAACAAWARSFWHADHLQFARIDFPSLRLTTEAYDLTSARGGASVSWGHTQTAFATAGDADEWRRQLGPADGRFHFQASKLPWLQYGGGFYQQARGRLWMGFGFRSFGPPSPPGAPDVVQRGWQAVVPWPAVVLLAGALPAARFAAAWNRRRRARRAQEGLCPRCGYDLRATPGTCPECGNV